MKTLVIVHDTIPQIVLVNWTFLRVGPDHDTGYFTDDVCLLLSLLLFMISAKIFSLASTRKGHYITILTVIIASDGISFM